MPTEILLPTAIGAHGNQWTQTGGTSKFDAVDPGDPIVHDAMTSRLHASQNNKSQSMAFEDLSTKVPTAKTVVSMAFNLRFRNQDGNPTQQVSIRSADSTILATTIRFIAQVPKSSTFQDYSGKLAPADGGDWTVVKADDVQMDWVLDGSLPENGLMNCTSVWLVAEYGETITIVQAPDETSHRVLRRFRFPEEIYRLQLGPRGEQIELWKDFRLVEAFGPEASGLGFGPEEWESRLLRCIRKTIDPKSGGVTIEAIDVRRYLTTFFLSGISDSPGKSIGTIRMDQGVKETFVRASKSWIEWSDGRVYEVPSGDKKFNHLGLLLEKERTNRILNSAFHIDGGGGADVFASWTEVTGAGASIVADATNRYFNDISIVKQHAKVTAGNPLGGVSLDQTTVSFAVDTFMTLSVVHQDDDTGGASSGRLGWDVQNVTSTNWFNATSGLWQASRPGNKFTKRSVRFRDTVDFQMETQASTLLLRLLGEETADQVNHIWQVDFIDGVDFPTSPILTTTAEVQRSDDKLKYDNKLGQEVISFANNQFTIQMVLRMQFKSTDFFAEANHYLIAVKGAATRFAALLYVDITGGPSNGFVFEDDTTGFIAASGVKPVFVEQDEIKLVWRRASSRGEYDLTADSEQLMVLDPTSGLWIEGGIVSSLDRAFDPATDQEVRIGHEDFIGGGLNNQLDGYIDWLDVRPFCLQKEEAKDFP